jgi:hypothetical protein
VTPVQADEELIDVRLLRLPLDVWSRAQEHSDALMREFALIASDAVSDPEGAHVPRRLLDLVRDLNAGYAGFTGEQEAQLYAAAEAGEAEIDLHYRVPRSAAAAAPGLGLLLDEADEYCRRGQHLLTMATAEDLVRFRCGSSTSSSSRRPPGRPCPGRTTAADVAAAGRGRRGSRSAPPGPG